MYNHMMQQEIEDSNIVQFADNGYPKMKYIVLDMVVIDGLFAGVVRV